MNNKILNGLALAVMGASLCGCITHNSVVYHDVERVKVSFESDAAARLFYETLSRNPTNQRYSESTTTVSLPIVFQHEQKTVPGPNMKFNDAVAICDSNKDGTITELEARIFANQK